MTRAPDDEPTIEELCRPLSARVEPKTAVDVRTSQGTPAQRAAWARQIRSQGGRAPRVR